MGKERALEILNNILAWGQNTTMTLCIVQFMLRN